MSERNVRDMLEKIADYLGVNPEQSSWWQTMSMDQIRRGYIEHMRDMAAGRGGDKQVGLAAAKTEEAVVKTALLRLDYNERAGALVPTELVAAVINDWARGANREYTQGMHRLVSDIQAAHCIEIDQSLVDDIAGVATERVKDHAARIGRDLAEGSGDVFAAEASTDGGLDQQQL